MCVFTDKGQLYTIKVSDIPFGKLRDKGVPIDNISAYSSQNERILCVTSQTELNLYRLVFVTKTAMVKVVDGGEFDVAKRSVAATKLADDDELVCVEVLKEQRNMILISNDGYFLRFPLEEIPEKKKAAIGVRGMKLNGKAVIDQVHFSKNAVESSIEYHDKKIELNKIKLGKRDSKGVKVRT